MRKSSKMGGDWLQKLAFLNRTVIVILCFLVACFAIDLFVLYVKTEEKQPVRIYKDSEDLENLPFKNIYRHILIHLPKQILTTYQTQVALILLSDLIEDEMVSSISYHAVLRTCARAVQWQRALMLLQDAIQRLGNR